MTKPHISEITNAILYERLNDNSPRRTIAEHIEILRETNTQLILRAYFRWNPLDNCNIFTNQDQKDYCLSQGATFSEMSNMNAEIKNALPDMLIIGAIPSQRIYKYITPSLADYDDYTQTILTPAQTEAMALDPSKWGIASPTKIEFQDSLILASGLSGDAWYPDLSRSDVQTLLLNWAKRQIDAGVDGIWIDLLYNQTIEMYNITDMFHLSVVDSFNAANQLIDNIHTYGNSIGRTIYVGTWASAAVIYKNLKTVRDVSLPNLDFLTVSPLASEVINQRMDDARWDTHLSGIREIYPDTPILAFLDSTDDNAPIAKFSQQLTTEQQNQFLIDANEFFKLRNIIFAFPVHGLYIGQSATKLSYDMYNWYDSKAPQFYTYDTIKRLMLGTRPIVLPSTSSGSGMVLIGAGMIALYFLLKKSK